MMMEATGGETEEVKIGGWSTRLPADICVDRDLFHAVFSMDTWNTVLSPQQRQRLIEKFPKEVRSDEDLLTQTIEDLFNGSLTSFSVNPLDHFFDQLEAGQFDPVVVDVKKNIKKELRKESIRRLKHYHTKLLEDIIVSRHRHLTRLKAEMSSTPQPTMKAKKATPVRVRVKALTEGKPKAGGKPKKNTNNINVDKSHVIFREANGRFITSDDCEGLLTVNNNEKMKICAPHVVTTSSSRKRKRKGEDDASLDRLYTKFVAKKAASASNHNYSSTTSPIPIPIPVAEKRGKKASTNNNNSFTVKSEVQIKIEPVTSSTSNSNCQLSSLRPFEKQAVVLKSSSSSSSGPQSLGSLLVPVSNATKSILSAALTSDKIVPTVLPSYTSSAMKSPILASQLQSSPQVSVKIDDSLNFFSSGDDPGSDSGCITLNYQKLEDKSSDDELRLPGPDEFDAIHPTIGFNTTCTSSTVSEVLKQRDISNTNAMLSNIVLSRTLCAAGIQQQITTSNSHPGVGTILPSSSTTTRPSPGGLHYDGNNVMVTVSNPSGMKFPYSNAMYIVSSKPFNESHSKLNDGSKEIGKLPVPIQNSSPGGHPLTLVNRPRIFLKGTSTSGGDTHTHLIPGVGSSGGDSSGHSQEVIRVAAAANADLLNAKPGSIRYVTSTGKNLILHSLNQVTSSVTSSGTMSASSTSSCNSSSSSMSSVSFPNLNFTTSPRVGAGGDLQFVSKSIDTVSVSSTSLSESSSSSGSGVKLNLSPVGLQMTPNAQQMSSLHGILNTDNIKLEMDVMDKIDDLGLDANPFDSIPNLSDELDGLDLDLVDGLCDFEGLLSDEKKYATFFSLIRDVLCSTRDHRMNLTCLERTIRKWTVSPGATLNAWFLRVSDWNSALVTALNFLAGTYQGKTGQHVHPEDFVPYIEYKYKTKYYQWIGAGRDSDNNLTPLCGLWMDNMDSLPCHKKMDGEAEEQEEEDEENDDSEVAEDDSKKKNKRPATPPPPRCVTEWTVRPSTQDERLFFRRQERSRFDNPHKAFTYTMHDYESVVGPVKGVYSSQVGMTNKARGHSLLVDDRPPFVTILALVRDAVARLPNGEGTRSEICEMLRDSAFLAPDASGVTLNSVVSGALDRLHYERDPCVRYDSHKKSWIYLHRDRNQEQFERLHHNRSYTKSTKSRTNGPRKARRTSATSTTIATKGTTTTTTTVNSVITALPNSNSITLHTTALTPTSSASLTNEDLATNTPGSITLIKTGFLPSTSSSTLAQRLATTGLPTSAQTPTTNSIGGGGGIQIKLEAVPKSSETSVTPSSLASYLSQDLNPSGICSSHLSSGRVLQIQSTLGSNSSPFTTEVTSTTQSPLTSPSTAAVPRGQFVLGSQAVLRLASALRLSQLRLPGNTNPGNVRVPQHRIVLTRGTLPGSGPAQGILLGQTATGQTVILSAGSPGLGNFGSLSSSSVQPTTAVTVSIGQLQQQQQEASPLRNSSPHLMTATTPSNSTLNSVKILGKSVVHQQQHPFQVSAASSSTALSQAENTSTPSNVIQLSIGANNNSSPLVNKSNSNPQQQQSSLPVNLPVIIQPTQSSQANSTPATATQFRHPLGYTIATVRGNFQSTGSSAGGTPRSVSSSSIHHLQSQNQTPPTSSSSSSPTVLVSGPSSDGLDAARGGGGTQLGTPIIIRSMQGDIMLPGHLALGKGFQGIKLIPFPMGNKTVLAKLVPPPGSEDGGGGIPSSTSSSPRLAIVSTSSPVTSTSASSDNSNTINIADLSSSASASALNNSTTTVVSTVVNNNTPSSTTSSSSCSSSAS